jgi:hypothetical protein
MRPSVGQGNRGGGVTKQLDDPVLVNIEKAAIKHGFEIVGKTKIKKPIPRILACLAR